jgi:hypothetical protein
MADLGFGQRFLRGAALPIELGLRGVVALKLLGDGVYSSTELLHHILKPGLVVASYPLPHGRRRLITRVIQLGKPLFVLGPLLQQGFDGHISVRG